MQRSGTPLQKEMSTSTDGAVVRVFACVHCMYVYTLPRSCPSFDYSFLSGTLILAIKDSFRDETKADVQVSALEARGRKVAREKK